MDYCIKEKLGRVIINDKNMVKTFLRCMQMIITKSFIKNDLMCPVSRNKSDEWLSFLNRGGMCWSQLFMEFMELFVIQKYLLYK